MYLIFHSEPVFHSGFDVQKSSIGLVLVVIHELLEP
jgi:hypothetical protein